MERRWSRRCFSSTRATTGAENSSGAQGIRPSVPHPYEQTREPGSAGRTPTARRILRGYAVAYIEIVRTTRSSRNPPTPLAAEPFCCPNPQHSPVIHGYSPTERLGHDDAGNTRVAGGSR